MEESVLIDKKFFIKVPEVGSVDFLKYIKTITKTSYVFYKKSGKGDPGG
jgi:hypothetical protein